MPRPNFTLCMDAYRAVSIIVEEWASSRHVFSGPHT